ncbi:MAG: Fic family protein [Candidatus Diapherotrites archaeon]|nr:Fic family protein [Candidatus Diapherotrites archaeon]
MFVEKRKSGKKIKYYLVHSFRVGKKVEKIRRFLGSDLSKKELEKLKPVIGEQVLNRVKVYKAIKDPFVTVLSTHELELIKDLEKKERFKVFHLSEEEWQDFAESFTYNTNAIEGSQVTESEVTEIIEKNEWPEKSRGDIAETYGLMEAINYTKKTKEHISVALIKKLHELTFKNSKSFAGKLRSKGQEVAVVDGYGDVIHQGAPSEKVFPLLKELITWYNKNRKKYSPLVLGAVVHNQFENIHPFTDGNGRVGRLLLNNILIKNGLPPVNIEFTRRGTYYESLREYEFSHNLRPTIEFLLKEYRVMRKTYKK